MVIDTLFVNAGINQSVKGINEKISILILKFLSIFPPKCGYYFIKSFNIFTYSSG